MKTKEKKRRKGWKKWKKEGGAFFLVVRDRNKTRRSPSIFRARNRHLKHIQTTENVRCPTNFCHEDCPSQQSQQDDQGVLRPRHEEGKYNEILFFTPNSLKAIAPSVFSYKRTISLGNGKPKRPYLRVTRELHFS